MAVGVQVYKDNGGLQFDSVYSTFSMYSRIDLNSVAVQYANTSPSTFIVTLPLDRNSCYVACRCVSAYAAFGGYRTDPSTGQSIAIFQCSGPVGTAASFYIFTKTTQFPTANFGIEFYNSAGQVTFSSSRKLMLVSAIISSSTATLQSGRTYATIQPTISGFSYDSSGVYRNGVPVVDTESPDGKSYTWSRQVNGKLYGTKWTDATVSLDLVSYDDVIAITNYGTTANPPKNRWNIIPSNLLLVDVTNY